VSDYGFLQDHADAFIELLRAQAALTLYPAASGGTTTVPNGAPRPYVTVHFDADRPLGGRLTHRSTRLRMRAYVHCVGDDDIAARAVSDLVAGALLDVVPTIPGRVTFPIRSEVGGGREPRANESTGETVVTITDTYRLESLPGRDGS
jgi:hypothetical protein